MGDGDVLIIKEGLNEVKAALTDLTKAVNDFRVVVARDYVPKDDFEKCKECAETRIVELHRKIDGNAKDAQKALEDHEKEERASWWKMAGLAAAITGIVLSAIQWVFSLIRGGGNS